MDELIDLADSQPEALLQAAERELEELDDRQRHEVRDAAETLVDKRIVLATKHAWRVAEHLELNPEELDPGLVLPSSPRTT